MKNIFYDKDFMFLYFSSGSTGFPSGALKNKRKYFRRSRSNYFIFKRV